MSAAPDFSIVTVCRNSAGTIPACLDSVLAQTAALEHVVVDGASSDGTLDLVREHAARPGRAHPLRWVSGPDKGPFDAMNKGIAMAAGRIVGILNADDRYEAPDVLDCVRKTMALRGVGCCYGDLVCFRQAAGGEEPVRYWRAGEYDRDRFLAGWMPPHPAFFVERGVYSKYGGFRLDLGTAADYELMLRFLYLHGLSCVHVPRVLVRMRVGGLSSASFAARLRAHAADRRAWGVNGLTPLPWTIPLKPLRKLGQWFARPPVS
ncbi:MAG: glycosyltransferase [Lentisphaerae bacterium]|nr:glycosyltransferase [Lentisphaerota bacterium]